MGFVNAQVQISEDDFYGMSEATDNIMRMPQQKLALLCMLRKTKLKKLFANYACYRENYIA